MNNRLDIKLFVTDVDGTLTDAGMYYTADGDYMKKFNTRDGMGMKMLMGEGITVAIMTAENSGIVLKRAEKLKIDHVYIGISDKLTRMKSLCDELGVSMDQVAYAGDDVNDLEVMKQVGLSFAVADADLRVLAIASVKLSTKGGEGAVREATEYILAALENR